MYNNTWKCNAQGRCLVFAQIVLLALYAQMNDISVLVMNLIVYKQVGARFQVALYFPEVAQRLTTAFICIHDLCTPRLGRAKS